MPHDTFYAYEKFYSARKCLMLPVLSDEAGSFADSFSECDMAFFRLDLNKLPSSIQDKVKLLKAIMDSSNVPGETKEIAMYTKAKQLSNSEKESFSYLVDSLAFWFEIDAFTKNN